MKKPGTLSTAEMTGMASGMTSIMPAQVSAMAMLRNAGNAAAMLARARSMTKGSGSGSSTRTCSNGEGASRFQRRGVFHSSTNRRPTRKCNFFQWMRVAGKYCRKRRKPVGYKVDQSLTCTRDRVAPVHTFAIAKQSARSRDFRPAIEPLGPHNRGEDTQLRQLNPEIAAE